MAAQITLVRYKARISRFALSGWAPGMLLALMLATPCSGQLQVLSAGDTSEQWRKVQIESLRGQIQAAELGPEILKELAAQADWLDQWRPGKMSLEPSPIEGQRVKIETLEEPIIDLAYRAATFRSRLLGKKAQPTEADTKAFQAALQEFPNDIGLRQLHLHWLDQNHYRLTYRPVIINTANRLIGLLANVQPRTAQIEVALAFAYYRKARTAAASSGPETGQSNSNEKQAEITALQADFAAIEKLIGRGHPEMVAMEIPMLRTDKRFGQALCFLENAASNLSSSEYVKFRYELLQDLTWQAPAAEARSLVEKLKQP